MKRLDFAGKRMSLTRRQPAPGDPCATPECEGVLGVYHTHVKGQHRIRYLRCEMCCVAPDDNKLVIPLIFAPPRRRKSRVEG